MLIANRGEIAKRIASTAAYMGIETVAIFAADDRASAHVTAADHSVELQGSGPSAYLDVEAVLAIATSMRCTLIHPGYGFLAENAEFSAACHDAGIEFVGPTADVLLQLGSKTSARQLAEGVGVPVARATREKTNLDEAAAFMRSLPRGSGVMVKAMAGGGGKGIRVVMDEAELSDAYDRCTSEALRSFGNGDVYVEELIANARHIEVQILGDGTGAVGVLGDRDCSLQRNRQKLVEIAPAPGLSTQTRSALHDSARRVTSEVAYRGLATVEFLVTGEDIVFLEVNPRIQVEHTVTEQVTGLDLVHLGVSVACGDTLADLHIPAEITPRGTAVQMRVNSELLAEDGAVTPSGGMLTSFEPPTGRGIRVDTHAYEGYSVGSRYDSLLAKLIVSVPDSDFSALRNAAYRAAADFYIRGVQTTLPLTRALLATHAVFDGTLTTAYLDDELAAALAESSEHEDAVLNSCRLAASSTVEEQAHIGSVDIPPGTDSVESPQVGVVVNVLVTAGDEVAAGATIAVIEAMKMEQTVVAPAAGVVADIYVEAGDAVDATQVIAAVRADGSVGATIEESSITDPDYIRPDLQSVIDVHNIGLDEYRPDAVAKRRQRNRMTAREAVDRFVDDGSFVEYGALAVAAQAQRKSREELVNRSPADGLVTGVATVRDRDVALLSYDFTVMAGTQGVQSHRKTDRMYHLARKNRLPLVVFAEGGGGRPGETDTVQIALLDLPTFHLAAELSGKVPTIAVVSGYCFAGNAALAAVCDFTIATKDTSLGMGGPAMIEGGGLGTYHPDEVGPMDTQVKNGVVDVLVEDDAAAIDAAQELLELLTVPKIDTFAAGDQRALRHIIPEDRLRAYEVREVIDGLADVGTVMELRPQYGRGIVTSLARIEGQTVGIVANNPLHLGGAIDTEAAIKATRFLRICGSHDIPIVSLCDTPGFMVGPASEESGAVRAFGEYFVAGAGVSSPMITIILRKGYGLGAVSMAAGSFRATTMTVSWPTGEFGAMGLEGSVQLGFRQELEAIADPIAQKAKYDELVAKAYEDGKAIRMAQAYEIDDVIDPAETRAFIIRTFRHSTASPGHAEKESLHV
ncbi:acetyl-CoA carboxylase family protein [Brevibacterium jeotgali]|nr:carboxyl transferase domain-containing protein [Brevibacterium jeotgali]